jgi:hypothetical protein
VELAVQPQGYRDVWATGYAITVGQNQVRERLEHENQERLTTAPALHGDDRNSLSYLAAVLGGRVKDQGDLSALDTNVTVMQILDAPASRRGQARRCG